jgi:Fe-S-cluster-containing dehydrogenase component
MDFMEILEKALNQIGWERELSRRGFLKGTVGALVSLTVLGVPLPNGQAVPLIIMENAEGLVMGDPTKCVGCCRCELACTEFNDGKAAPSLARIKVTRNMHYGPGGAVSGHRGKGAWGNGIVIQDTCNQCPHPVPCANTCPQDAIVRHPKTGARVVDTEKCTGCKLCLAACPWDMMSFDPKTGRASKCFLCHGDPKCVEACPAAALRYVAWHDLTRRLPPRRNRIPLIAPEKAKRCLDCHSEF